MSLYRAATTASFTADAIEAVYAKIPYAAIGVDIMAGFPGEDEIAHHNSWAVLKDLPVSYLHVFPFSPRPGTVASRLSGRVAPDEIKKRAARLRILGDSKRLLFYQGCLNREFPVLAEKWESRERGLMQGRSDNYLPVLFRLADYSPQDLLLVRMDQIEDHRVIGTVSQAL